MGLFKVLVNWLLRATKMSEKNNLLEDYSVGVRHPEVSGFEALELLDIRSQIAKVENQLTEMERRKLEEADSLFLNHARKFYKSLNEVTDLAEARERQEVSPSHWWWYLEKLDQEEKVPSKGRS